MGDDSAELLLRRVPKSFFVTNVLKSLLVTKAVDETVAACHPSMFTCAVQQGGGKMITGNGQIQRRFH